MPSRAIQIASIALLLLAAGCGHGPIGAPVRGDWAIELEVNGDRALAELDPRYLSVALDTAQVLGGKFWSRGGEVKSVLGDAAVPPLDLSRIELQDALRSLAPAYLRIGGTARSPRRGSPGAGRFRVRAAR